MANGGASQPFWLLLTTLNLVALWTGGAYGEEYLMTLSDGGVTSSSGVNVSDVALSFLVCNVQKFPVDVILGSGQNVTLRRTLMPNETFIHHASMESSTLTFFLLSNHQVSLVTLGGTSAWLAGYLPFPASLAGKEYYVITYTGRGEPTYWSWITVLALTPYTQVSFTYPEESSDVVNSEVSLSPEEEYIITSEADLTGLKITSDAPVMVLSGGISPDGGLAVEQMLPVGSWGRVFVVGAGHFVRVLGKDPKTKVIFKGEDSFLLGPGDFLTRDLPNGEAYISSNNPISVVAGIEGTGAGACLMTILPKRKWSKSLTLIKVPSIQEIVLLTRREFQPFVLMEWEIETARAVSLNWTSVRANPAYVKTSFALPDDVQKVTMVCGAGAPDRCHLAAYWTARESGGIACAPVDANVSTTVGSETSSHLTEPVSRSDSVVISAPASKDFSGLSSYLATESLGRSLTFEDSITAISDHIDDLSVWPPSTIDVTTLFPVNSPLSAVAASTTAAPSVAATSATAASVAAAASVDSATAAAAISSESSILISSTPEDYSSFVFSDGISASSALSGDPFSWHSSSTPVLSSLPVDTEPASTRQATSVGHVPGVVESPLTSSLPRCSCRCKPSSNVMAEAARASERAEAKAKAKSLRQELSVERSATASSKRRKSSARDVRSEARSMGGLAVAMLVIVGAVLVLPDLPRVVMDVWHGPRKRRGSEGPPAPAWEEVAVDRGRQGDVDEHSC